MKTILVFLSVALAGVGVSAQGLVGMEKQILPMTRANWIAFRNYDGHQLVYFTHLVVYRCGLSEIRYSINSGALDQRFSMPPCDPQRPNEIPADYQSYLTLPLGSASSIAVQVVYADGEESETHHFAPCVIADEGTCAQSVD